MAKSKVCVSLWCTNQINDIKMQTVTIKMFDELNEVEVERVIDISNVTVPNYKAPLNFEHDIIGTEEQQKAGIEFWINERGNDQHDTILTLISWELNK